MSWGVTSLGKVNLSMFYTDVCFSRPKLSEFDHKHEVDFRALNQSSILKQLKKERGRLKEN